MYLTIRMPSCLKIQCFNSTPSPNEVSEVFQGNLLLTVQHMFHLWDAMSLHWSSRDPPLPPEPSLRKGKNLQRAGKYYKHGPLLTQTISFSPKSVTWQFLFTCQGLPQNIIPTSQQFWTYYIINSSICFQLYMLLSTRPHMFFIICLS